MRSSSWRWAALLLALTMIAAACNSATSDTTQPGDNTETTDAPTGGDQVKNPGLLVHAADDEPSTLDPAQVEPGEGGETVILQVYERLLEIGSGGPDLVPGLALEVPTVDNGLISADGMTYTFKLREGVKFHDGTDFTASDVKYSWDRVIEMDLPEGAS